MEVDKEIRCFLDLDDSGFQKICVKIDSDEYGEIPEALHDYLLDGDGGF